MTVDRVVHLEHKLLSSSSETDDLTTKIENLLPEGFDLSSLLHSSLSLKIWKNILKLLVLNRRTKLLAELRSYDLSPAFFIDIVQFSFCILSVLPKTYVALSASIMIFQETFINVVGSQLVFWNR